MPDGVWLTCNDSIHVAGPIILIPNRSSNACRTFDRISSEVLINIMSSTYINGQICVVAVAFQVIKAHVRP